MTRAPPGDPGSATHETPDDEKRKPQRNPDVSSRGVSSSGKKAASEAEHSFRTVPCVRKPASQAGKSLPNRWRERTTCHEHEAKWEIPD